MTTDNERTSTTTLSQGGHRLLDRINASVSTKKSSMSLSTLPPPTSISILASSPVFVRAKEAAATSHLPTTPAIKPTCILAARTECTKEMVFSDRTKLVPTSTCTRPEWTSSLPEMNQPTNPTSSSGNVGSIISSTSSSATSKKLRWGKWTKEEEAYTNRLIADFSAGVLQDVENGTTMRSWLSMKLSCCPMRISKKFVGEQSIGKRMFERNDAQIESMTGHEKKLLALEVETLYREFCESWVREEKEREESKVNGLRKRKRNKSRKKETPLAQLQTSDPSSASSSFSSVHVSPAVASHAMAIVSEYKKQTMPLFPPHPAVGPSTHVHVHASTPPHLPVTPNTFGVSKSLKGSATAIATHAIVSHTSFSPTMAFSSIAPTLTRQPTLLNSTCSASSSVPPPVLKKHKEVTIRSKSTSLSSAASHHSQSLHLAAPSQIQELQASLVVRSRHLSFDDAIHAPHMSILGQDEAMAGDGKEEGDMEESGGAHPLGDCFSTGLEMDEGGWNPMSPTPMIMLQEDEFLHHLEDFMNAELEDLDEGGAGWIIPELFCDNTLNNSSNMNSITNSRSSDDRSTTQGKLPCAKYDVHDQARVNTTIEVKEARSESENLEDDAPTNPASQEDPSNALKDGKLSLPLVPEEEATHLFENAFGCPQLLIKWDDPYNQSILHGNNTSNNHADALFMSPSPSKKFDLTLSPASVMDFYEPSWPNGSTPTMTPEPAEQDGLAAHACEDATSTLQDT